MTRFRKTLLLVVLSLALASGALLWPKAFPVTSLAASAATPAPTTTATATAVVVDVSATGSLQTLQTISLSWEASGKVSQVLVKKGDTVEKNQVLAEIDTGSNLAWATTQANLLAAQESLAALQDVAVSQASAKVALIKAQIAVTDAQNYLKALYTLPSQAAIDAWKVVVIKDDSAVTKAEENNAYWVAYEYLPHCQASSTTGGGGGGAPGGGGGGQGGSSAKCNSLSESDLRIQQANAKSALSTAEARLQKDEAYLSYLQNYQPAANLLSDAQTTLAIAQQQLVVAQANYDAVKDGPDPVEIAVAQAKIDTIQAELDKQVLRAPFAGTVTDLGVKAGDVVSSGSYALRIDDMSSLLVELEVSEIDINQVSVGQVVTLQFDAVPDKQYQATVTAIDPIGSVSNGVASFTVTAVLEDKDSLIKPGMTAEATFVVD